MYVIIKNSNYIFSEEDIEEIASDVFLAIWKNKEKLDVNKEISPYIAGIARNLISKKYMTIKNKNENIDDLENYLYEKEIQIEDSEKINILTDELKKLKEEDRNIFTYYYYEAKKIKEIAYILDISETKVKSRLSRIRKKLKKELERRGYSYGRK